MPVGEIYEVPKVVDSNSLDSVINFLKENYIYIGVSIIIILLILICNKNKKNQDKVKDEEDIN